MAKNRRNGQVYKKMYQTYMLVLCVPILFSILFYYYIYEEVKKDALLYNGNLNNTIQNICDTRIRYYRGITYQLRISDAINNMIEEDYRLSDGYWNAYVVLRQLKDLKETMANSGLECRDVFLYLEESDKIVYSSSVLSLTSYSREILGMDEEETEAFRSYLQELKKEDIITIGMGADENCFLLLQPVKKSSASTRKGVVGIVVNMNDMDIGHLVDDWYGEIEWTILDVENKSIRRTKSWELTEADFEKAGIEDGKIVSVKGEKYLLNMAESEVCSWRYVLFIPMKLINSSTGNLRAAFVLCLLTSLTVGYWIMRKSMEITYKPLEKVISIFKMADEDKGDDEYNYLSRQVNQLIERNKYVEKGIYRFEKDIRNFTIEQLVMLAKIDWKNPKYNQEIMAKFENGNNVVLIFWVNDSDVSDTSESFAEERDLQKFIICNVMEEKLRTLFIQETCLCNDEILSIIHITDKDKNYVEVLQKLAEEMNAFIWKKFRMRVYMLEGGMHQGLSGIHEAYLEACQTKEFAVELNELYVRYDEIRNQTVYRYPYSFEMQQIFIHAIHQSNEDLANSIISDILDSDSDINPVAGAEVRKYIRYDIFSTLLKLSQEAGVKVDKMLEIGHVLDSVSREGVCEIFADIVKKLCNAGTGAVSNMPKQELCQKITKYIDENFTDPDLNVSQIALEFELSPSYLSSIYKKNTGDSILEIIRNRRIEYAKTLLSQGRNIAEVSVKCGFRESTSFVRVFKKTTGVTPGQLKNVKK